jgi:ABC-type protease/lipase transport system fused ATPase/permease subunit
VRLDGADMFSWSRDDLGRHIGYLPQEVSLFSGTIAENIARLGELRPEEVVDAAQKANVHDMILRLPRGYDTEIGDAGWRLSGGQRQRIGLARALYGNPSFVLLDEPNANLDSEGDMALVRALAELKAQNATVIFITHRPGLIKYADKLILLRNGITELYGPREEIIDRLRLHGIGTGAIQDISKRRSSTQVDAMPRGAAR